MARIALIDGDVVAYRACMAVEEAVEFEPGYWVWYCDETAVKRVVKDEIDRYMAKLDATEHRVCLTTPTDQPNFRIGILHTYKAIRANVKKPLVLKPVRQWMLDRLGAVLKPTLEGDDILGIYSTWLGLKGDKIIVSIDKDMKTIPGLYLREMEGEVVEIDEDQADWYHMYQTLMGDQTDGYSGLPGVGPKKAEAILEGATEGERWSRVVAAYEKKGLGEEEALTQARVARILRASDYDFKKKRPILWTPPSN